MYNKWASRSGNPPPPPVDLDLRRITIHREQKVRIRSRSPTLTDSEQLHRSLIHYLSHHLTPPATHLFLLDTLLVDKHRERSSSPYPRTPATPTTRRRDRGGTSPISKGPVSPPDKKLNTYDILTKYFGVYEISTSVSRRGHQKSTKHKTVTRYR